MGDQMKDLLKGGVKLTVARVGLGPELALPMMKIVLHEEFEIKTVEASLVPGHEQKGISFDHGGKNLGVVWFSILVVVEVLGQDDGGMPDFFGRSTLGAEDGNPEDIDVLGNFLSQGSKLAIRNPRYVETWRSRIQGVSEEQKDCEKKPLDSHSDTEEERIIQRQSKKQSATLLRPSTVLQYDRSSRRLEN